MMKKLQSQTGSAMPLTAALVLVCMLLFCGISEYAHLLITAQGVRDALQSAATAVVAENYDDTYHTVREGYSSGYAPTEDGFATSLDSGAVANQLDKLLGLDDSHTKTHADGSMEFRLQNVTVQIRNTNFAPERPRKQVMADCTAELLVPVSFAGSVLHPCTRRSAQKRGLAPAFSLNC